MIINKPTSSLYYRFENGLVSPVDGKKSFSKLPGLFDSFAEMLAVLPSQSIKGVIDRECIMLVRDLMVNAALPPVEVGSILGLGRFMQQKEFGEPLSIRLEIPQNHLEIYRWLVRRLVSAGELPPSRIGELELFFKIRS